MFVSSCELSFSPLRLHTPHCFSELWMAYNTQLPGGLWHSCLWGSYTYEICFYPINLSYINLNIRSVKKKPKQNKPTRGEGKNFIPYVNLKSFIKAKPKSEFCHETFQVIMHLLPFWSSTAPLLENLLLPWVWVVYWGLLALACEYLESRGYISWPLILHVMPTPENMLNQNKWDSANLRFII